MKRVTGIGGIFFKTKDPDKVREWYRTHLGIEAEKDAGAVFKWRQLDNPQSERCMVWSPFPNDTDYFAPSEKPFMINFQVENLEKLLAQLKSEGVQSNRTNECGRGLSAATFFSLEMASSK